MGALIDQADQCMREGRPGDAFELYRKSWRTEAEEFEADGQVWLQIAQSNAAFRSGQAEPAFNGLRVLPNNYPDAGNVVGNPLFHLLVGLCLSELGEMPDAVTDNFARALICGGPEIFTGEDPVHLAKTQEVLLPPEDPGTWEGYEGCGRNLLNGAFGYLRELVTERIGSPPPFPPPIP